MHTDLHLRTTDRDFDEVIDRAIKAGLNVDAVKVLDVDKPHKIKVYGEHEQDLAPLFEGLDVEITDSHTVP